jgi:uncharacterized metal-binding protein YceD (DUF177 family)
VTDHLDWIHGVTDIPIGGLDREREATESERQAIAEALGLLTLGRLTARYRIKALADAGYRLSGKVMGEVEQACIVTLDPVTSRIDAPFDVEFRPQLDTVDSDEDASVLAGPDIDVIERGTISVGRIVFETLSGALEPYPRRPDAEFTWQDQHGDEPEKTSPFAALSKLKSKD